MGITRYRALLLTPLDTVVRYCGRNSTEDIVGPRLVKKTQVPDLLNENAFPVRIVFQGHDGWIVCEETRSMCRGPSGDARGYLRILDSY
jgi:hypothetical protein